MTSEGLARDAAKWWAERIAAGHAYRRPVVVRREYPSIGSREEFARLIEDVLVNPDEVRSLELGRWARWQDRTQTLVIVDRVTETAELPFARPTARRPSTG